jgi:hypothetical protein
LIRSGPERDRLTSPESLINLPQTKKIGNDVIRRHQLTGLNRKSLHPSIRGREMRSAESSPQANGNGWKTCPFGVLNAIGDE